MHHAPLTSSPWPRRWLWLGVAALAIAGLFSIILVSARTPQLAVFSHLFSVSLVVHVDLSVLVWFLALAGMWLSSVHPGRWPCFHGAAWGCAALATALMALSPLHPSWEVIKSNYIPVLDNPPFLTGLALLVAGLLVALIPVLASPPPKTPGTEGLIARAVYALAGIVALALVTFFATAYAMPAGLPRDSFFETLFWAGGHVLQFAYTQLAMIGWLVIALACGLSLTDKARARLEWVMPLSFVFAFITLPALILYDPLSGEFRDFYTLSMKHTGGIAPLLLAAYLAARWLNFRGGRALRASLAMSLLLFAAGGGIGYAISGQNVTIPAHYHGSIVGVTLALMGMAYALLPRFGYRDVSADRLAFWQPVLYGGGQLLHISGLAWSGGYGVLRKSTDMSAEGVTSAKAALGLMGLGGLLAIIGGLLFVVVVVRARKK